ncbi:NAD(P)H-hydrate dehydratase [Sphingomonas sp. GlSt437]|uniref:NAD(P)H-hydrate dehydratase n=1 Tax=Sphingomonas sp. GlSt437 TaxID=3389970 RepID=UPI003A896EB3
MTALDGLPVLSAAAMRAAEDRAIARDTSVDELMARAGAGVAEWVARLAGSREVLILCGPGNNGGDGYVTATRLRAAGHLVRVAASAPPATDAASRARDGWGGAVDDVMAAAPAPVIVDALFGTGLSRALSPELATRLKTLVESAWLSIAVDLPSGLGTDDGADPGGATPPFDITLALGALKPVHLLQPGADRCGAVRVIDIGLGEAVTDAADRVIARPILPHPGPADHKYTRGLVAVVEGAMPGAAALAITAALHTGAGYALLIGEGSAPLPHAIVRKPWSDDLAALIGDRPTSALVIGPGLGRDAEAVRQLKIAIASTAPLVIDGDALHLLTDWHFEAFSRRLAPVILTPHAGEFSALFGAWEGSKLEVTRAAARRAGATVVFKGADTVIAAPDGTARLALAGDPWLSAAGTGDVLAGAIGAMLAARIAEPAAAGVWLHGAAARRLTGPYLADDLAIALSAARASL